MRYYQGCAAALLPALIFGYNPFKGSNLPNLDAFEHGTQPESALHFSPREVLTSRSHMPEIYNKALRELSRLEEKPLCHRLAAQLSMDSCKKLDENGQGVDRQGNAHIHSHSIESFTIALAMCDLELGEFIIPDACTQFTSSALLQISRDGGGDLQVSSGQKDACLKALSQDHSHWYTLLSNRGTALLFCQAARIDIEKDEYILFHKKLAHIIAEFGRSAEDELSKTKRKMEEQARATDLYYSDLMGQAQGLKSSVQNTVETFSHGFKDATISIKALFSSIGDLSRLHRTLMDTFLQSNAEVAAGQEQALAVMTNAAKAGLKSINHQAGMTEETLSRLNEAISLLIPSVVSLGERQSALEETTRNILSNFTTMTELLQHHTDTLQQASSTATGIHHSLEKAAAASQLWSDTISSRSLLSDYSLRIGMPLTAVFVGNYGMAASLTRNIGLFLGGLGAGETFVQLRHCEWPSDWFSFPTSFVPSTSTHLARQKAHLIPPTELVNSTNARTCQKIK